MYRILATARSFCNTPGAHLDYLRQHDCELLAAAPAHPYTSEQLAELVGECDGVVLGLDDCDAAVIARANRLRVISRYGVGYDRVDIELAAKRGIVVTNTPGANQIAVAELTIALMFELARRVYWVATAARTGRWERPTGWELTGKTLGVIGLGAIGREVAKRALGLQMHVIAYDPYPGAEIAAVRRVDLDTLIRESDVLSLHAALTSENDHLINARTIDQMRPGSYLINTARGGLVDEAALYQALISKHLAGAAMDAFQHEPPEGSPLLQLENFIATPHIGATTRESVERMAMMAAQNVVAILNGEPCNAIVNAELLRKYHHA